MIEFCNVTLAYENDSILDNLNFKVEKNKVNSIIGINGCGKTTLINSLINQKLIKSGKVYFENTNIKETNILDSIALMNQINLSSLNMYVIDYLRLTQFKNKNLFNIFKSYSNEDNINYALNICDIKHLVHKKINTLSGGQIQKIFLAFCLSQNPKLIILDEPSTYLDINSQHNLMSILKKLTKENKITVLCIHHDLEQVLNFSDKLIVIDNKKIILEQHVNRIKDFKFINQVFNTQSDVFTTTEGIYMNFNYKKILERSDHL